jgi:L-ribulose-5-phosphate 4-epimerase
VLEANLMLSGCGLVTLTAGNASGIDRDSGLVVIKPSGLPYAEMSAADMVVVALDGEVVEGSRRPSTDTPTHLALYKAFGSIGGVVHTHSTWATAFAQAEREIPILGTTHADLCPGPVPLTRALTDDEIAGDYERATGELIAETIGDRFDAFPAVLVRRHGPFCWAGDAGGAAEAAFALETVAQLALLTALVAPGTDPLPAALARRHFDRKHGEDAYYGQPL